MSKAINIIQEEHCISHVRWGRETQSQSRLIAETRCSRRKQNSFLFDQDNLSTPCDCCLWPDHCHALRKNVFASHKREIDLYLPFTSIHRPPSFGAASLEKNAIGFLITLCNIRRSAISLIMHACLRYWYHFIRSDSDLSKNCFN